MATRRGRSPSPQVKLTEDQINAANNAKKAISKRMRTKTSFFNEHGYTIVIGLFVVVVVLAVLSTLFSGKKDPKTTPVVDQEEIESHNAKNLPYRLGSNEFFNQWMLADAKKILNVQLANKQQLQYCATHESSSIIPERFNFREAFKQCAQPVWNQGNCSSSYAVAAVSAIQDRVCKARGIAEQLSPQQLLSCDKNFTLGCDGGYVSRSFDYAKRRGIVSRSCLEFNPNPEQFKSDKCEQTDACQRTKIIDQCIATKEEGIKREIYTNGPVVSVIPMYRDFLIYKDGVYKVIEGSSRFQSGHAVKIIGWDQDSDGNDYWIVENSWGESWGINGFAHIATKQKELFIDEYALAPVIEVPKTAQDESDKGQKAEAQQEAVQDI